MNSKLQVLFGLLSTSLLSVSGQTNWNCNHYSFFPADVCIGAGSLSFLYECEGSDAMIQAVYLNGNCSGTPYSTDEVDDDDDFQCDQSSSCDYMVLDNYNDTECENLESTFPVVTGQCLNGTGESYEYGCTEEGNIALTYYYEDNDCSGGFIRRYEEAYELFGNNRSCSIISYCENALTEPPTTTPIEDGNMGPLDCNVAIWGFFPLLEGVCSYIDEGGNDLTSYMAVCANDGESATIYEYNSNDCSGAVVNETIAEKYYCGADSNGCGTTTMTFDFYNTSEECEGDAVGNGEFNFATISGCFNLYYGIYFLGIDVTDDSVNVGFYFGDDECDNSENREGGMIFEEGCNNLNDSESIDATFGSTDGTDSGSTDSGSTDSSSSSTDGNSSTNGNSTSSDSGNGNDDGAIQIGNTNIFTNVAIMSLFVIISCVFS